MFLDKHKITPTKSLCSLILRFLTLQMWTWLQRELMFSSVTGAYTSSHCAERKTESGGRQAKINRRGGSEWCDDKAIHKGEFRREAERERACRGWWRERLGGAEMDEWWVGRQMNRQTSASLPPGVTVKRGSVRTETNNINLSLSLLLSPFFLCHPFLRGRRRCDWPPSALQALLNWITVNYTQLLQKHTNTHTTTKQEISQSFKHSYLHRFWLNSSGCMFLCQQLSDIMSHGYDIRNRPTTTALLQAITTQTAVRSTSTQVWWSSDEKVMKETWHKQHLWFGLAAAAVWAENQTL